MADRGQRVRLVCEDRLTEQFLSRVCQRRRIQVLHVEVAPSGKGAASAWVRRKYPAFVKLHRSKNYQKGLCLLVAIDGDHQGIRARKLELAQELITADVGARAGDEPMAIFVPTWSIETWLASLSGGTPHDEDRALKEDSAVRHLWQDHQMTARTIAQAADNWRAGPALLPSLEDAYTEGDRIGV